MNRSIRSALAGTAFLVLSDGAFAQTQGDATQGLSLAKDVCAECHAVEEGRSPSPNADAPTFEALANTPGMTAIALRALLQTPHRTMPNIIFENTEMMDISAYILSLK